MTRGKPHPDPFLAGAALLGIAPKNCVVFEDSAAGAVAGRAAGCTVVATTFSHPAELLQAAHHLVEDLTGVKVETTSGGLLLAPHATRLKLILCRCELQNEELRPVFRPLNARSWQLELATRVFLSHVKASLGN